MRLSATENDNITEMISTPLHAKSINEAIGTINNKELYDTLWYGFLKLIIKYMNRLEQRELSLRQ